MSNTNYPRQLQQLGLNIARYRKLRGLTQEELAALISMSRTHLSNLEAPGKITSISLEKLFTIADVLNVSPASVFRLIFEVLAFLPVLPIYFTGCTCFYYNSCL